MDIEQTNQEITGQNENLKNKKYEEEMGKEMGEETKMKKEIREMEKHTEEEEEEKLQGVETVKEASESEMVDDMDGLYIRLVLKREGRADLVWLYKTHKF